MPFAFRRLCRFLAPLLPVLLLLLARGHASARLTQSATLGWDAESDPTVAGYCIYYGTASGDYGSRVNVGNNTVTTIQNLELGRTYYFVVTAYNSANQESSPSQEVAFTVSTSAGIYTGLVSGAGAEDGGAIHVDVLPTGAFTGAMIYEGTTYRLKGVFNAQGDFVTNIVPPGSPSVAVSLHLNGPTPGYGITGSIGTGAQIAMEHALYGKNNPAPNAGQYTIVIASGTNTGGGPSPTGNGAAVMTITPAGQVRIAGVLADGTKFSQKATLSGTGTWNLYLPLAKAGGRITGALTGAIQFENVDSVSDLDGSVTWTRPPNAKAAIYQEGFAIESELIGSAYSRRGTMIVSATNPAVFTSTGAGFGSAFTETLTASNAGAQKLVATGAEDLKLAFNKATGFVSGSFRNLVTGEKIPVRAVVFQKQGVAAGSYVDKAGGTGGLVEVTGS